MRSLLLASLLMLAAACTPPEDGHPPQEQAAAPDAAPVPDSLLAYDDRHVGQTIYVPAYSHIYHQDGTREFNLTTTLSIRNTDPEQAIVVTQVRYHNSNGNLIRQYVEQPLRLAPLASKSFVVEERDKAGGVGANFIVTWQADVAVSSPVVEAVMISTAGTQGLSFVSVGRVIREHDAAAAE